MQSASECPQGPIASQGDFSVETDPCYESEKIAKSFTRIRRNTEKLAETLKRSIKVYSQIYLFNSIKIYTFVA